MLDTVKTKEDVECDIYLLPKTRRYNNDNM